MNAGKVPCPRTQRHIAAAKTSRSKVTGHSYHTRMPSCVRRKIRWREDLVRHLGSAWPRLPGDRYRWGQCREGLLLRETLCIYPDFSSVHTHFVLFFSTPTVQILTSWRYCQEFCGVAEAEWSACSSYVASAVHLLTVTVETSSSWRYSQGVLRCCSFEDAYSNIEY